MSRYGRELTKEQLIASGITEITPEGRVFRGEIEVNMTKTANGYLVFSIYDRDEKGNLIKLPHPRNPMSYVYKTRSIGLHRAMYAWFHGKVPEGKVVDHVDNKHTELIDYRLPNLQLLTPSENLTKEKDPDSVGTRMLKCKLWRPRTYYEDKVNNAIAEYEAAKACRDTKRARTLRTTISCAKARLRYYDAHLEEAKIAYKERNQKELNKLLKKIFD